MSIPIIIIHKHDSYYLPYCLYQAKVSNPNSDIFLIGDHNNEHYKFVNHRFINDYVTGVKDFQKIYKHFSNNIPSFEIFCFQRWFILRNFMQKHQLKNCVHIDSDILLYADLSKEQDKFCQYDFTLTRGYSGHCSFFNSRDALEGLCDFMMSLYQEPSLFKLLQEQYQNVIEGNQSGGVSDMFALQQYRSRHSGRIGEMSVIRDNSVYDCSISKSDGFDLARDGRKRIVWQNGQPFGVLSDTKQLILFNSLHFQGSAKKYMKHFLQGQTLENRVEMLTCQGKSLLNKLNNKLTREKK